MLCSYGKGVVSAHIYYIIGVNCVNSQSNLIWICRSALCNQSALIHQQLTAYCITRQQLNHLVNQNTLVSECCEETLREIT